MQEKFLCQDVGILDPSMALLFLVIVPHWYYQEKLRPMKHLNRVLFHTSQAGLKSFQSISQVNLFRQVRFWQMCIPLNW